MAGKDDGKRKPGARAPVPAKPTTSVPARRAAAPPPAPKSGESSFDLQPVRSGPWSVTFTDISKSGTSASARDLPSVGDSGFEEVTNPGSPSASIKDLRRVTSASVRDLPRVGNRPGPPVPDMPTGPIARPTTYQSQLQSSGFDDDERTQVDRLMGNVSAVELDEDEEEPTAANAIYDGEEAAPEVTSPDSWKAVAAPVQSRPGKRSARVYWSAIDQFAVGTNRRYTPDGPGRWRTHIFVWDVTRAMGCEVPHMVGGREQSLAATVEWLRREGPLRGWRRLAPEDAAEAADRGEPVLAVPRDPRQRLLAVVRPGGADESGHPRLASAGPVRGNDLGAVEALGTDRVEYFGHA